MKTLKCPWCGRDGVGFSKSGTLVPHLTPGQLRCVGAGQSKETVVSLRENMDQRAREPRK